MIPTLFGITLLTFLFVNLAPGGPLDQQIQKMRFGKSGGAGAIAARSSQGISPEVLKALKKRYGFDKPIHIRYWLWLKSIARLDFGQSFDYGIPVMQVIKSRFPVSLQFGLVSFILTYLLAVTMGLIMAYNANKPVDGALGTSLLVSSAMPPFAVGVVLLVFFAGGSFLDWFPLGYLHSENYHQLNLWEKILDRVHHFLLPLFVYMLGAFTALTFLTRNSVLDEVNKQYVRTAQAQGASKWRIYSKHVLRNALIPVVTGIGGFLAIFLSGSLLVEQIFQLNGIGRLGFQSLMTRDYNMIMGLTFLQSVALLIGNLLGDLVYVFVDPRIDFAKS